MLLKDYGQPVTHVVRGLVERRLLDALAPLPQEWVLALHTGGISTDIIADAHIHHAITLYGREAVEQGIARIVRPGWRHAE